MKKLISWTISSAAAALLVSTMAFAQPPPAAPDTTPAADTTTVVTPAPGEPATTTTIVTAKPVVKSTTVTVEKTKPAGFRVCYLPGTRHIEGTRVVQRCGAYGGCRDFRITRSFEVKVYEDCHVEKYSCSRGYHSFGWYPNKAEARNAVERCHHTVGSGGEKMGTEGWKITY